MPFGGGDNNVRLLDFEAWKLIWSHDLGGHVERRRREGLRATRAASKGHEGGAAREGECREQDGPRGDERPLGDPIVPPRSGGGQHGARGGEGAAGRGVCGFTSPVSPGDLLRASRNPGSSLVELWGSQGKDCGDLGRGLRSRFPLRVKPPRGPNAKRFRLHSGNPQVV